MISPVTRSVQCPNICRPASWPMTQHSMPIYIHPHEFYIPICKRRVVSDVGIFSMAEFEMPVSFQPPGPINRTNRPKLQRWDCLYRQPLRHHKKKAPWPLPTTPKTLGEQHFGVQAIPLRALSTLGPQAQVALSCHPAQRLLRSGVVPCRLIPPNVRSHLVR